MLTQTLEKLILCGKASYNTFVVGGSQKYILNVKNDHYIIITNISYQSALNIELPYIGDNDFTVDFEQLKPLFRDTLTTQLKVFSNKSNNTFLFRNNFDIINLPKLGEDPINGRYLLQPKGTTSIDTYLVHESAVSFTFSNAGTIYDGTSGPTPSASIGFPPPFDYGKDGQTGKLTVRLESKDAISGDYGMLPIGEYAKDGGVNPLKDNLEFIFPVDKDHRPKNIDSPIQYPIVNVQYVEIKGRITDIEATL